MVSLLRSSGRRVLLLLLFALLAGTACAQETGILKGRITHAETGEALAYVNVVVRGEGVVRGTSTSEAGRYRIGDLPPGRYRLTATIVGYEKHEQRVTIEAGQTHTLDLQLAPRRYGMNEVVVSALRSETALASVPASVTVLGVKELDRQRAITGDLGAILAQAVPGLAPSSGTLSNYGQTLRGRNPVILIDGVPQSTPLRAASRDLRTIDPSAIERVEIVRGASALYGYGATGGAINIITKRPTPGAVNFTTKVGTHFSFRSSNSFSGSLMQSVSGRTGTVDYFVSGAYESRGYVYDAEGDLIPQNPHGQGGLANADEVSLLAKTNFHLSPEQQLGVSFTYYDFKQSIEYNRVPGEVGRQKATAEKAEAVQGKDPGTQNVVATLTYTHDDVAGSRLEARAYMQDFETRFGFSPYFPDGGGQSFVRSTKFGARLDVETPLPLTPGAALLWGIDLLRDETAQPLVDGRPYVPPMTQTSGAPFAQLKLPLGTRFVLRGGARYERIGLSVDDFTTLFAGNHVEGGTLVYDALVFNAGGVVFLTDALDLFASFAQGFSIADVGRVLRSTEAASVEQLNPEAQKVNSYELGLRVNTAHLRASLVGFISTSELGSTYSDLPELAIIRSPERVRGVEATLDLQPLPRLGLGGTFTYLEGKHDTDDDGDYDAYLPGDRIPPLKLTGYVAYAPTEGWHNRLQVLYSGSRDRFEDPDPTEPGPFGEGAVDAYTTVDFYSAVDVGPGTLQLGIENLLNNFYFPTISQWYNLPIAYAAAPGRQVSLSYTLRW